MGAMHWNLTLRPTSGNTLVPHWHPFPSIKGGKPWGRSAAKDDYFMVTLEFDDLAPQNSTVSGPTLTTISGSQPFSGTMPPFNSTDTVPWRTPCVQLTTNADDPWKFTVKVVIQGTTYSTEPEMYVAPSSGPEPPHG
jgi:hypothetical protein